MNTTPHHTTLIIFLATFIIQLGSYAQNETLTRVNEGASWKSDEVSANVRAKRTSSMPIQTGVYTTVTYSSEDYDVNGNFDHTTGIFTPPEAGYYVIMASLNWTDNNSSPITNDGIRSIILVKNGTTEVDRNDEVGRGWMHSSLHTVIESDGTDNYQIQAWQNSGSNHDIDGHITTDRTIFTAFKLRSREEYLTQINGGASWGGKRTCIKARNSSTIPISTGSTPETVTYSTEEFDLNNDFDESTGIFTPPKAGYYVIMATANWQSTNTTLGERSILLLRNDGSVNPSTNTIMEENSEIGSNIMTSSLHTIIESNGSDNYRIQVRQNSGSDHEIGEASGIEATTFVAYNILDQDLVLKKESGGASWKANNASGQTCVRAKRTSNLTTTSNILSTVTSTDEDFDVNGDYDHTIGVFTPPAAGHYVIMATVNWQTGNSVAGRRNLKLIKNLTNNVEDATELGSSEMTSSLHTVIESDGTDNYRVRASQTTGLSQDIGGTTLVPGCIFTAYRLD